MTTKQAQKPPEPKYTPVSVAEMCASLPNVFRIGAKSRPPMQTLEQWARAQ